MLQLLSLSLTLCSRVWAPRIPGLDPGVGEDSLEEGTAAHSSILAWRTPLDRGGLRPTVHEVAKSQTRLERLSTSTVIHNKRRKAVDSNNSLCSVLISRFVDVSEHITLVINLFSDLNTEKGHLKLDTRKGLNCRMFKTERKAQI